MLRTNSHNLNNNNNNFDLLTVTSEESISSYSVGQRNRMDEDISSQQQQQKQKDPFHHNVPLLRRFAKRAIITRVERTRQEQVAAKASELLVQEQTNHRLGNSGNNMMNNSTRNYNNNSNNNNSNFRASSFAKTPEPSTGSFHQQGSFFCGRMESYSDLRASMMMNQSSTTFDPDFSSVNNNNNNTTKGNKNKKFVPAALIPISNSSSSAQQQQQPASHNIDVTFQALVEELRETVPRSGLPTPDIALIMDRLLSKEVPVHFISHLQKLRHVLREVTRTSRSIRRHVELHGDAMVELSEVLDEDAEDEEIAREDEEHREREAEKQKLVEMKQKLLQERREQGLPQDGDAKAEEELEASILAQMQQDTKPNWLGNVPRLRTCRPRRELLERMSQLVQRGDMHATRVIDDVLKWRKQLNCPLPFFHTISGEDEEEDDDDSDFDNDDNPFLSQHNSTSLTKSSNSGASKKQQHKPQHDNVFFLLHRRYGGGMPFNRACDLLRRYAAGEVFFYVSPFDFSVSDEMNQDDGTTTMMLMREASLDSTAALMSDDDDEEGGSNNNNNHENDNDERHQEGNNNHDDQSMQNENNNEEEETRDVLLLSSTFTRNQNNGETGFLFDQHQQSKIHNELDDENQEFSTAVPLELGEHEDNINNKNHNQNHNKSRRKSINTNHHHQELSPISKSLEFNQVNHKNDVAMMMNKSSSKSIRTTNLLNNQQQQITRARPANLNAGKADMRDKWKKVEQEAKVQNKYLRRTLVATAGGWYRPVLKVVCELLWERHTYSKQQAQGRDRTNTGGSYMRFASKGRGEQQHQQNQPEFHVSTGISTPNNKTQLASHFSNSHQNKRESDNIYLNSNNGKSKVAKSSSSDAPPRTTVAAATEGEEVTLGLDWKHISAGCYIPIISRDLRTHLIVCYRCALQHVARHNPGISASAGTAVQRLIALNASHLARRYLHLWQAALRRRKKLRLQAEQLALKNMERHKKLRFQTLIKFFNFRNESGRLWRPLLVKCRATLVRRYMHRLFLNRALNIVTRSMRRAVYLRYYRTLHFLVVRRRISAARITFAEEGDTRKKIRQTATEDTREALKELAAASSIVGNASRNLKMRMERYYASEGDALRVVSEAGGGVFSVPSLCQVIQHGRYLLPLRRFSDAVNVERARIVASEFLEKRFLIFQFQLLGFKSFAESHGIVVFEKKKAIAAVEETDENNAVEQK